MADTPNSYKDPFWVDTASRAEAKVGLPAGLLQNILLHGERSNNDQISEAGAKTPFQIIPATRKAILDKYGIDPYLNAENAAEGAALLLKESLDRNKGDVNAAVGEYHGGTNRKNWGPRTTAYQQRIGSVTGPSADTTAINTDIQQWLVNQSGPSSSADQVSQVKAIGDKLNSAPLPAQDTENTSTTDTDNVEADASVNADIQQWLATKAQFEPVAPAEEPGILARVGDAFTGNLRATPETESLPEWTGMPELNQFNLASAKTGLGTLLAGPKEISQVIKANFPDAQIRQDSKGNYLITSPTDGKEYAIPPGVSIGDIPRIVGGFLSFLPAGKAMGVGKTLLQRTVASGAASAGTQAAIEASQAATGGEFNPGDVAAAGTVAAAFPAIGQGLSAAKRTAGEELSRLLPSNRLKTAATEAAEAVPPIQEPSIPTQDLAKTARSAAMGNKKDIETLAKEAVPDVETAAAADRLGIKEYLQPDHLTTKQAYREVAQAIKSVPGSQTGAAEKAGLEQVAKRADDIITELGGTRDLSTLSQGVKDRLAATHDTIKGDASKLYNDISNKLVKTATPAPAPNTLAFIKDRARQLGGEKNLTSGEKKALSVLSPKGDKEPTYALLDQTRKDIGAAKRGAQNSFGNADAKLLGDLESVLRADQGAVAAKAGLGAQWEEAQALTKVYKGLQDDLTSLFGKNIDQSMVSKIGSGMQALTKGDATNLARMIKAVPEDMRQEVVASGLASAFNKSAPQGAINFGSFAKWYQSVAANKQAYTALMSNLPLQARTNLKDLYKISEGISKATKERITTGRLQVAKAQFQEADSLAGKIYEQAKASAPANIGGAVAGTVVGSVAGPGAGATAAMMVRDALNRAPKTSAIEAADKLLSSQEFQRAVNQAIKGDPKKAAKILAFSRPFKNYAEKLKDPIPLSDRERWILQAIQTNQSQQANSR